MPRNSPAIPSPAAIERAMADAEQIKASLTNAAGALDVDVADFLQVLEEDTNLFFILDKIEELVSMKRDYAKRAAAKVQQLNKAAEAGRATMLAILHALEAKKVERPTYTASIYTGPSSLALDDAEAIPFELQTVVPDTKAITAALKAGEEVPGAHLNPGKPTLRITRGKAQENGDAE